MADIVTPVISALAALAGVAMTYLGTASIERRRWQREQVTQQRDRAINAFADLLHTTTAIEQVLRQTLERLALWEATAASRPDLPTVADEVDKLVREAQRHATLARFVGPKAGHDAIGTLMAAVTPIRSTLLLDVNSPWDADPIRQAAREVSARQDLLIAVLRVELGPDSVPGQPSRD